MQANWYEAWGHMGHPANRGVGGVPAPVARSQRDKGDKVMAVDVMIGRRPDWERGWNNHLMDGRKRPNHADPNYTVNFEGGNVLYNDGHAEWHNVADTKMRWTQHDWFDAFW